ncbi:HYR domain-containing protein [Flavivirga algicola]|uniref:HYR domain-containing protein n=1 Tax=Flavivirga algicola TaxID=2729136 RepID=A0ABX1RXW2_9FLAO|nr:HYR domain-containing protein [Flavivirga algicola]NMH88411.1 HYR domain-containing protein [Flavivirga algicola]
MKQIYVKRTYAILKSMFLLAIMLLVLQFKTYAQCGPGEDTEPPVFATNSGDGTLSNPFVNLLPSTVGSVPSGRYYFKFNGSTFQGELDNDTDGGGWLMILNYVHIAGNNSNLQARNTDLPLLGSSTLGDNEAGTSNWGHFGNQLATDIDFAEMRFYSTTSGHNRIIDFKTDYINALNYVKSGTGSFAGLNNNATTLAGHTANIPVTASLNGFFADQGDFALTNFPFYVGGLNHWGIRGLGNRWEVDDFSTNSYNTIHRVWVRGDLSPVTSTEITATLDDNGNVTIAPSDFGIMATDNCSNVTLSLSQTDFDCSHVGSNTIQLTATDASNNPISMNVAVIVAENPPVITVNPPVPATFELDAVNGTFTLALADLQATATDDCGLQSLTLSQTDFDCSHIGLNTVTLTATDANGHTSTTNVDITIADNTLPTVQCVAPFTILLDTTGNASITVTDISDGFSDNCTSPMASIDISNFDCSNIGDNTVTLSVTDTAGNVSTCSTVVTVDVDATTCPSDIIINNAPGQCGAVVSYPGCNNLIEGLPSGSLFPIGTTLNVFELTDNSGATVRCSFSVTVNDNESPMFSTKNTTVNLDSNGSATIQPEDLITKAFTYGIDTSGTFDPVDISATGIEVTLSDDEVSSALPIGFNFTFYGNDYTEFYISSNGFITFSDEGEDGCCNGESLPNSGAPSNLIAFDWTDINIEDGGTVRYETRGTAPNRVVIIDFDNVAYYDTSPDATTSQVKLFESTNIIEIHGTSTKDAGNDKTQGVENIDGTAAVVVPGRNESVWSTTNDYVAFIPQDIVENCSVDTITATQTTFNCSDLGDVPVTITVTDINGNATQQPLTITVADVTAPGINCPTSPLIVGVDGSGFFTLPDYASATDSCDSNPLVSQNITSGTQYVNGDSIDLTITATDASGNTDTCMFTITVDASLSLNDVNLDALRIYPNPATDTVTIANNGAKLDKLEVLNLNGQLLISETNNLKQIDISQLNTGVYFVKLHTEYGSKVMKLIKE